MELHRYDNAAGFRKNSGQISMEIIYLFESGKTIKVFISHSMEKKKLRIDERRYFGVKPQGTENVVRLININ